ncbi:hypothetical protein SAMN05444920_14043 [Nonomuraea solani]|uniref:Uncharacterized protein n=1 Tax=Nonomuraea solani TaxID=1144553 RepID=A0A1H6F328_9ACTN|nr:hypothetical protein [Nonomuraea solani]SEH03629.1 hypothetical protein SAMN05444920_14043 [Nonomuraea solani]
MTGREVLKLGDRIRFDQTDHTVVGISGTAVRLQSEAGSDSVVLQSHLLSWNDFQVIDGGKRPSVTALGLLDTVAPVGDTPAHCGAARRLVVAAGPVGSCQPTCTPVT